MHTHGSTVGCTALPAQPSLYAGRCTDDSRTRPARRPHRRSATPPSARRPLRRAAWRLPAPRTATPVSVRLPRRRAGLPGAAVRPHSAVPRCRSTGPALVLGLVVAPVPTGPQRLGLHPVAARDAADQRRGRLSAQGSGTQEAGRKDHSTTVSCSPIREGVFAVVSSGPRPSSAHFLRAAAAPS